MEQLFHPPQQLRDVNSAGSAVTDTNTAAAATTSNSCLFLDDDIFSAVTKRGQLEVMVTRIVERSIRPFIEQFIPRGQLEVMVTRIVERSIRPFIEQSMRTVVKEELGVALEKVLSNWILNPGNETSTSQPQSFKLQFLNKISPLVWTGKSIEGEANTSIQLALVDDVTGQIVKSGHGAEANVEIVVLEEDNGGERDNWTHEEFNSKIVREWNGKPILRGNTCVKLKEGIGCVSNIAFAHSAEWRKNHNFRLGARIKDAVPGISVIEAKTESFILKDRRATLNGKSHPPLSSDEVWRLENIHKKGAYHKRLRTAKINTVSDFVTLLAINPKRLQKILEVRAADKAWKVIVKHAQECVDHKGVYLYHDPSYEHKTGVVFSVDGQLMGIATESQYVPVDQLSKNKKAAGQKSVISASEHWEEVVSFKDEASLINTHSLLVTACTANSFQPTIQESPTGSNCRTSPLTKDYAQPSSHAQVVNSSPSASGVSNNLDNFELNFEDYNATLSVAFQGYESSISDYDVPLWCYDFCQPEIPNIGMQSEQQGSAGGILFVTPQTVSIDRTQKIWPQLAKLVRRLSIRRMIGAIEPDEVHTQKKQRCC